MKISVLDPLSFAFDRMSKILFSPFDITKWFVIGFAAFLTQCGEMGGSPNLNCGNPFGGVGGGGGGGGGMPSPFAGGVDWMVVAMITAAVVMVLLLFAAFVWLGARGHFVLMHCIAKDEAAIGAPWSQYARPADSYFLLKLVILLATWAWVLLVVGGLLAIYWNDFGTGSTTEMAIIVGLALILPAWLISIFISLVARFVLAPVMFSREMTVTEAWPLVRDQIVRPTFWPMMGMFGMQIIIAIGMGIAAQLVACLTCLIGALPYINTVLILPLWILVTAYSMRYVEQYGFLMFIQHESLEQCPSCTYDLRGNPQAINCPECGFDLTQVRKLCPECGLDLSTHPRAIVCPECDNNLIQKPAITQAQALLRAKMAESYNRAQGQAPPPPLHANQPAPPTRSDDRIDLENDEPFTMDDDDDLDLDLDLPEDEPESDRPR